MGLDLYHSIPCLEKEEALDYWDIAYFNHNPDYLKKNAHFITKIEEPEYEFRILIFPNLFFKDIILKEISFSSDKIILIGAIDALDSQIKEIETTHLLIKQDSFLLKHIDNLLSKRYEMDIYYHSLKYKTSKKEIQAIYLKDKGYQRKGMSAEFYQVYKNETLYFDKTSVINASKYLEPTWNDDLNELRKHFRNNFIDNFVEGESIFWGNW